MIVEDPFSRHIPALQIAWDQTSMSSFQTCPRRYYYEIIEGWVARSEPINFFFGRVYHKALEMFDKCIAEGLDFEEAQDITLRVVLEESYGWESFDKVKNRETLIRTVVWYTEHYRDDQTTKTYVDSEGPAVERSFRIEAGIRAITGEDFILTGHIDRLVHFNYDNSIIPEERKTTKQALYESYWSTFTPGLQVTWYIYGAQIILPVRNRNMLISSAQTAVGFSDFGRTVVKRNEDDFNEFIRDVHFQLGLAEKFAEEEYWPKYERNCWICPFKDVCSKPADLRKNALQADFAKRTWNPLETR